MMAHENLEFRRMKFWIFRFSGKFLQRFCFFLCIRIYKGKVKTLKENFRKSENPRFHTTKFEIFMSHHLEFVFLSIKFTCTKFGLIRSILEITSRIKTISLKNTRNENSYRGHKEGAVVKQGHPDLSFAESWEIVFRNFKI